MSDRLLKIRNKLSDIATSGIWSEVRNPLDQSSATAQAVLKDFTELVVSEGASLYKQLAAEPELGPYIRKINELPTGSSISIETDCALFPWEILYPDEFNIALPRSIKAGITIEPEKLWGNRFVIEYFISSRNGSLGIPPIEEHRNGRSFVSLNLNPTLDEEFEGLPYKPVAEHSLFFDKYLRKERLGELRLKGDLIKKLLLSKSRANVIYLYCHGKSDDPFDKGGGEQLELDADTIIEPSFFNYGKNKYRRGPIVILNSCSSGAYSPISFSSFYSELMKRRALGVIGTTIAMPATFASAFGQRLIHDYVKGDKTIGEVLRNLRKELLANNNPLGLFYALQCPWHVKAPQQ